MIDKKRQELATREHIFDNGQPSPVLYSPGGNGSSSTSSPLSNDTDLAPSGIAIISGLETSSGDLPSHRIIETPSLGTLHHRSPVSDSTCTSSNQVAHLSGKPKDFGDHLGIMQSQPQHQDSIIRDIPSNLQMLANAECSGYFLEPVCLFPHTFTLRPLTLEL